MKEENATPAVPESSQYTFVYVASTVIIILYLSFKPFRAQPAPMCFASYTSHVIAARVFICWGFTTGTFTDGMRNRPKFIGSLPFVMTLASVPNPSALEAGSLATFTISPIRTYARFAHDIVAIRLRTLL